MIVEPPWLTLTPTLRNLVGPPTYSVIAGSATLAQVQDKVQVLFGNMGSDRVTIKATISDGGVVYADQMTLVKLVDGGTAISHLLTNETHALMADSVGNVLSYMGASGEFRVWEGATEITADCAYSIVTNTANMLCSISNLGRYAVTGMPSNVQSATIVFRATYHGTNYDETFILTKIPAPVGSGGDPTQQVVGGKRLPMNFTVPIPGTTWSTVAANQAVIPYNGTVLNDIVTEYNNSAVPPYKETRFWNFTEWVTLDAKIDGNLLVTGSISADKLAANSITADKIAAGAITADQIDVTTLRVNGVNIEPNSVNTGHLVSNAVTVPAFLSGTGSDTKVTGPSGTYAGGSLTVNYPYPVTVEITANWQTTCDTDSTNTGVRVSLDGAVVLDVSDSQLGYFTSSHSGSKQITVAAGNHTYSAVFYNNWPSGRFGLLGYGISIIGAMR